MALLRRLWEHWNSEVGDSDAGSDEVMESEDGQLYRLEIKNRKESLPLPRAKAATEVEARKVKLTQKVSGGFRCGRVGRIRAGCRATAHVNGGHPKSAPEAMALGIAKKKSKKHMEMFP